MPSLCFMLLLKPLCSGVSSGIAHPSHQPNNVPPVVSHLPSNFPPGGKLNLVHHLLEWGKELDNSKLGETLQLWGSPEND